MRRAPTFAIGADLAKFVAPDADITLEVLPTAGSAANIKHLRYDPGVKFAIVQADVYQAFLDRAAAGNADAGTIIRPLRVILPLYNTEIHYIVRADSPLNYLHDIKNAKDQRRHPRQRRGPDHAYPVPDDVQRPHPGGECELPLERGSAGQADRRQVGRCRRRRRGTAGAADRQHEARGAEVHQAAEVRSRASLEQAAADGLFLLHRQGEQLPQPVAGETSRRSRWGRSWSPTTST